MEFKGLMGLDTVCRVFLGVLNANLRQVALFVELSMSNSRVFSMLPVSVFSMQGYECHKY